MEDRKKGGNDMCTCGCYSHGGTRMLFRLLLSVIILVIVFWAGVRLGEMRESIRSFGGGYYPDRMMQGYGGYGGMMPVGTSVNSATPTTTK